MNDENSGPGVQLKASECVGTNSVLSSAALKQSNKVNIMSPSQNLGKVLISVSVFVYVDSLYSF